MYSFSTYSVSDNPADYRYCYNSYAGAVTEVEIDVLTGKTQVLRVDILYDCGTRSLHASYTTLYFLDELSS